MAKEVRPQGDPAIVAGDPDDVAWSYAARPLQRFSGSLDPSVGRGLYAIYSATLAPFRRPPCHVFHTSTFTLTALNRLDSFGSDRFPILVERRDRPQEAREKIEEGRAEGDQRHRPGARAPTRATPPGRGGHGR